MGKLLVALLATLAALAIVYHLVGPKLSTTAFNVPGTDHTSPFSISWVLVCGGVLGFAIWRIVKGK